uniref:Uncharacterized protein n=1 Tax=Myotis myotis TaxID=51298 RepID=A0A7J7Z463_MYOMY|nr:hypothetical protein mMyoMyo1_010390 [Myotis myotis]
MLGQEGERRGGLSHPLNKAAVLGRANKMTRCICRHPQVHQQCRRGLKPSLLPKLSDKSFETRSEKGMKPLKPPPCAHPGWLSCLLVFDAKCILNRLLCFNAAVTCPEPSCEIEKSHGGDSPPSDCWGCPVTLSLSFQVAPHRWDSGASGPPD